MSNSAHQEIEETQDGAKDERDVHVVQPKGVAERERGIAGRVAGGVVLLGYRGG